MRYTKISMTDVIIVGAGAAGLMTAITAARRGLSVTVLEPNGKTGKKLRITGKGRCNVTNDSAPQEFLQKVCTNARFLKSSLYAFPPEAVKEFFEEAGVPLKTERGERVFPVSDNANDIADTLERMAKSAGVRFVRERLVDIRTEGGHVSAAVTDRDEYPCRAVVLCTGGLSYPATGSTGDGYRIASKLGHTIVPTRASLVPLEAETDCARMQGLSLRNVGLTLFCGDKVLYREQGEMLFTHFGVSGPLVLSASAHLPEKVSSCRLEIDLKPGLTAEKLDERLLRDFSENINRDFTNALDALLPQKLIPVVIERSGIPARLKVNSIRREQRLALRDTIKRFTIRLTARRPVEEAIVTAGGVDVREVNPRTMESKIVSGLYFAGEILDLDACTGGYNLQHRLCGRTGDTGKGDYGMKPISIAIDGPSGAGKSTIARKTAEKFGFIYVDTGAIYRTVGLAAYRRGIASKDSAAVIAMLPELHIELRHGADGLQRMFLDGEDVSDAIRMPEISIYASDVSAVPEVRAFLMEMQRSFARTQNVIMDGRDIGTVVLPDAGLKIFLTASVEARAKRRQLELEKKGKSLPFEEVLRDMEYRDKNDSSRAAAPLRPAEDAVRLDTTQLDFDESCAAVESLIRERFAL